MPSWSSIRWMATNHAPREQNDYGEHEQGANDFKNDNCFVGHEPAFS